MERSSALLVALALLVGNGVAAAPHGGRPDLDYLDGCLLLLSHGLADRDCMEALRKDHADEGAAVVRLARAAAYSPRSLERVTRSTAQGDGGPERTGKHLDLMTRSSRSPSDFLSRSSRSSDLLMRALRAPDFYVRTMRSPEVLMRSMRSPDLLMRSMRSQPDFLSRSMRSSDFLSRSMRSPDFLARTMRSRPLGSGDGDGGFDHHSRSIRDDFFVRSV